MSVYVFLGPSLPVARAREILPDAVYLPPVAMGDVRALLDRPVAAIGVVDGLFHTVPAVFHKELLDALARGIPVYGAASMGALRAAELHPFGMRGVGRIFAAFRDGELEDDDEVAVAHGPADTGFQPLSDAMVNIREGLALAVRRGLLDTAAQDRLIARSKAAFYVDRSWRRVFADAAADGVDVAPLQAFVRREAPDAKRDDALEMLRRMAAELSGHVPRDSQSVSLRATSYWRRAAAEADHAARWGGSPSRGIPADALSAFARLFRDPDGELVRDALLLHLIAEAAEARGLRASAEDIDRRLAQRGDADEPAARALAASELAAERLLTSVDELELASWIPVALHRRGRLADVREEVRRRWQFAHDCDMEPWSLVDASIDRDALLRWYCERSGQPGRSLAAILGPRALARDAFFEAVMLEYLFED